MSAPPQETGRGPVRPDEAPTLPTKTDQHPSCPSQTDATPLGRQFLVALARKYERDARRKYDTWVVNRCPAGCGSTHIHRGLGSDDALRRSGCGVTYIVRPVGGA